MLSKIRTKLIKLLIGRRIWIANANITGTINLDGTDSQIYNNIILIGE